jgi:ribosomal protein L32E
LSREKRLNYNGLIFAYMMVQNNWRQCGQYQENPRTHVSGLKKWPELGYTKNTKRVIDAIQMFWKLEFKIYK